MNSFFMKLFFILCTISNLTLHGMNVITCRTIKSRNFFSGTRPIMVRNDQFGDRLVATSGNYLAAICCKDICVWDLDSGQPLYTIIRPFGNEDPPHHVVAANGKLIALDYNSTIVKVWNLADGDLLHTLNTPSIRSFQIIDKKIVIFSNQNTSVWNFDGQCLFTIPDSNVAKIIDDKIVAIKNDKSVEIWTLAGGRINRFDDCANNINAITLAGNNIIYATRDKTVKVRNVIDGTLVSTFDVAPANISRVEVACNKIITQSTDHKAKVWNFDGKCLRAFTSCDFTVDGNTLIINLGAIVFINLNDFRTVSEDDAGEVIIQDNKVFNRYSNTINIFRLSDNNLLHTLPDIAYPNKFITAVNPFIVSENRIITMPDALTINIWTDTRPGATKQSLLPLATALHPRCGQHSPAKILSQDLMKEIGSFVKPEPWATSDTPMQIRYIQAQDNTYCAIC